MKERIKPAITSTVQETSQDFKLTHICLVDLSTLINWTSPFPMLGVSVYISFLFYFLIEIRVSEQC